MRKRKREQKRNHLLFVIPILLAITFSTFFFTGAEPYHDFNWEGIRPEMKDSIIKFSRSDAYDLTSYRVGEAARTPAQWYCQNYIRKNLTLNEALILKKFPENKVKALAFELSVKRNQDLLYSTMFEALNDTNTFVHYQTGCLGEVYLLAEYLNIEAFYLGLDSNYRAPYLDKLDNQLGKKDYSFLDSLYNYRVSKKWDYIKN